MADPLSLLQEYAMNKRELGEVKHNGKLYYVFGDIAYPHDAKTNLGVYNKQDEYYSIESILLFWNMRDLQHTAYVRDVSGRGIASITRVQRRDLLDFLNGGALPKEANMLAPVPPHIPTSHLHADESQQHAQKQYEPERKRPRIDQHHDKKGQRIDKILEKSIEKGNSEQVRGLSNELSAERVAQLRSRVKSNLKNKALDEESFISVSQETATTATSDSIGRFIAEKERTRKDRTTCLESQSRDFSSIISVLKDLQMRENQAKSLAHHSAGVYSSGASTGTAMQNTKMQRQAVSAGYSRYDQEIFQRETVADFEIETDLSFHGQGALVNNQQQRLVPTADAVSSLPSNSATTNGIHKSTDQHPSRPNSVAPSISGSRSQPKRVSRTPIIVIPATGTALITMYNARDILQDLRFVSSEEKKRTYSRRDNELLLQIQKNNVTVPYRVIDNPTRLKDDEWERIVAVFVQGPAWQFKGWKWNGNPVEIFSNVAAFHLKFEEQKMDPNVAKWSVNVLQLSRTKRHLDRAILQRFWEILDRHIAKSSKRDWLRY
uniref:Parafibromin n=1 Tax=Meloidogyne floridensis TaxID=298350 RepID=A0A915NKF7_9BILA